MEFSSTQIAELVKKVLADMGSDAPVSASSNGEVPVGVSNRHIHLTKADMETLFGVGYELTPMKDLSQPGQYACKETLTLIGPAMRPIENVRVLGPLRNKSQVEISTTDSYVLKVKPPVRESGNIAGSAPVTIIGPKGVVQLKEGCIVANRHIHMSPADGAAFGVKDGDTVTVEDGPLSGFIGTIKEINDTAKKARIVTSMFGRSTEVEVEYVQIKKVDAAIPETSEEEA